MLRLESTAPTTPATTPTTTPTITPTPPPSSFYLIPSMTLSAGSCRPPVAFQEPNKKPETKI